MADDKNKRDFRDRNRVSAEEDYELDYMAEKFNVDRQQVLTAIKAVGDNRQKVEEFLSAKND